MKERYSSDRGVHECSFEDTLLIYWSDLKLRPEVVTSATNLVQEADPTPFASASSLSKKIASNASINGRNLEMILMHDSPCRSHLVVHAFKLEAQVRLVKLRLRWSLGSKFLVLVQIWLAWWSYIQMFSTAKPKLHLALAVFGNVELSVLGTVQVCDFCIEVLWMGYSVTNQMLKAFLFPTHSVCTIKSWKTYTRGNKIFWLKMLYYDFMQDNMKL